MFLCSKCSRADRNKLIYHVGRCPKDPDRLAFLTSYSVGADFSREISKYVLQKYNYVEILQCDNPSCKAEGSSLGKFCSKCCNGNYRLVRVSRIAREAR